jgi:tripartite-type tricarboxylate transporter receptor subunit TctC
MVDDMRGDTGRRGARVLVTLVWATAMVAAAQAILAAEYPAKPVRVVVPFAPGGGPDTLARIIAPRLTAMLAQQFVVDNRAGAGSAIGTEFVARAPADGYTLLLVSAAFAINPALYSKLPYDSTADFAPVGLIASYPVILVVHPSLPVKTVPELVSLAKRSPGQLSYASGGNGSSSHLAMELFRSMTKIDVVHVPYRSAGPAMIDLLGGHVVQMFATLPTALGHVKGGKVRALAVGGSRRVPDLANVPTVAEAGVSGYEASGWAGVLAPAGTPQVIVRRISAAIAKALEQPEVQQRLRADGAEPVGSSPEAFAGVINSDAAKWAKVIRAGNIRVD